MFLPLYLFGVFSEENDSKTLSIKFPYYYYEKSDNKTKFIAVQLQNKFVQVIFFREFLSNLKGAFFKTANSHSLRINALFYNRISDNFLCISYDDFIFRLFCNIFYALDLER